MRTKIFNLEGQQYISRYVSYVTYPDQHDYGYANVVMHSGSSIHLPTREAMIKFLFEQDWFEPIQVL